MTLEAPVLEVKDLHLHFPLKKTLFDAIQRKPQRIVKALNGVSLEVMRGETLGIVGESGCGKSTLARCLARLYEADKGTIHYDGQEVAAKDAAALREYNRRVQMMFQDPYSSLNPRMSVRQVLCEALSVHKMRPPEQIDDRIAELLELVRLPQDAAEKLPHEFSGGQRQRIAIARALSVEPEVLVADELVSALDVSVQAQVVNLLLELQDKLKLTILFVAHDLRLVRHVSHRVAVIYLGSIVEIGDSEQLFNAPRHPYSKALLAAAPSLDPDKRNTRPSISGELPSPLNVPKGCAFHARCPHATARCQSETPQLRAIDELGHVAYHHAETLIQS
ncbi:oligopeptide/dipeptide ABC transporter ATP-binding protein [Pseudovibrio sp. Tun.PSC04-5.I4]|uniref:ABC transporter ATP-binding protein n=1 Tax=Pseudovibrio sp. Tun.PSC04-5.I4 TaxID=1798213 RepID=UPI000885C643|nr:oligopeptide/dipeptide ABC transporter ATP-binding protein [Pseudovibrio sp. Tun.PSC04-5.I4]SDQ23630.1 oligopeptide transport system ATP-binding protein [Pseudovibrio sp. Tun.PSC04-5.I4]